MVFTYAKLNTANCATCPRVSWCKSFRCPRQTCTTLRSSPRADKTSPQRAALPQPLWEISMAGHIQGDRRRNTQGGMF